jgi:hypothetical protein
MNDLDPERYYLALQLKWGREDYEHNIGFNAERPEYLLTELRHKDVVLSEPAFLYKYCRPDENSLLSLKNNYLYFSNPKNFGDEYDCLISDDPYIIPIIDDSIFKMERLGVCCFCTIPDEDQMWDYYSAGFKGFVIKYKNSPDFLPYDKMDAINSHIMYLEDNGSNNQNLIETLKALEGKHFPQVVRNWQNMALFRHELCRKRKRYDFEKEFRIIALNASDYERKIPINKSCADSIYIGNKMSKEYLEKLIPILRESKNVKIFVVSHDYKNQQIKFLRMKNISQLRKIMI